MPRFRRPCFAAVVLAVLVSVPASAQEPYRQPEQVFARADAGGGGLYHLGAALPES